MQESLQTFGTSLNDSTIRNDLQRMLKVVNKEASVVKKKATGDVRAGTMY